jgi:hypothetical protein
MPAIATIYEHSNYNGRALRLQGVGDYDYSTLTSYSFNDLTSSIKLESGYYLQAFADAGFKGASAIFTGSTSYVGNGFNDKISSLRLARGTPNISTVDNSNYGAAYRQPSAATALATIYEHANYGGRALRLNGVGNYDYATLESRSFNDPTSSIKIESGYYLQAYADAGFKGASAIFTGSTSYVGNGFNDKISSLRLVRGTPNHHMPSTVDGSDIITGKGVNNFTSPFLPLSHSLLQGVWNNYSGAIVLEVAWKDPDTGAEVKRESLSFGRGSYMLRAPNESAFDAEISANAAIGSVQFAADIMLNLVEMRKGGITAKAIGEFAELIMSDTRWTLRTKGHSSAFGSGKHLYVSGSLYNPKLSLGGPLPDSGSFIQIAHDTKQRMDILTGTGHNNFLAPSWAIPRSPAPDTSKMIKVDNDTKQKMDRLTGPGNNNFHTPFWLLPSTPISEPSPPSPISPINAGTSFKQMMDRLTGAGNNNFI